MKQYKVLSRQNIYDIAITLHGTVEGVFDLLISNPDLSVDTILETGRILQYNEDFLINKDILSQLDDRGIQIINGNHYIANINVAETVKQCVKQYDPRLYAEIIELAEDNQKAVWMDLSLPKMVVKQSGKLSAIKLSLKPKAYFIIDWGDYTSLQYIGEEPDTDTPTTYSCEHYYNSSGEHRITIYGNIQCNLLDLTKINGIYYPLTTIYASDFRTSINTEEINQLITQQ